MNYWGLDQAPNIASAFYLVAEQSPDRTVYSQAQYDGQFESKHERRWVNTSYRTVKERVNKIANYLRSIGVNKGTKVAIISTSRPEWMEADVAILACAGISVSIYQTLPEAEVAYILYDSGAEIVFAENEEQVKKLLNISGKEWNIPGTEDREPTKSIVTLKRIISFEECFADPLVSEFREIVRGPVVPGIAGVGEIKRDDIASFVYTSGTTGPPKGVVQTHGNHLANVRQAAESGLYNGDSTIMLFLPLAHSFAKLMGYVGFLTPASLKFIAIIDTKTSRMEPVSVTRDIMEGSAKIVPIVPRLLEKMKEGILRQSRGGGLKGTLLKAMLWSAEEVYNKRGAASWQAKFLYELTAPLRSKVKRRLFGPNFQYCVSGGAKLAVTVGRFFDALGIEILEGYGLTETCVATNVNRLGKKRVGTVGPVLAHDVEQRILEDGEICFRGPNVSLGYHNRPTSTAASWSKDGWFATGDLGTVDPDGFLTITGRKKEIIVASTGKKISPQDIEDKIKSCPYISQVVMIGEGRPYCVALMTLNEDAVRSWTKAQAIKLDGEISENKEVKELIKSSIDKLNSTLANFEQIKKFALLPGDFTVENSLLTPTFKVKRKAVEERYRDIIQSLY